MYRSVALMEFKEQLAYKYKPVLELIGTLLWIVLIWYLWTVLFASSGQAVLEGFTFSAMMTYAIISNCITSFNRSFIDYYIEDDVKTGFIAIHMIKPYRYPFYNFFNHIGQTFYSFICRAIPIFLIGVVFLNITMPVDIALFAVSSAMSFLISFLILFLTGLWSFWTSGNIWGLRHSLNTISTMISGSVIPLAFFPTWLAGIASYLPFKYVYSTPLSIYIGNVAGQEAYIAIAQQMMWVIGLSAAAFLAWKSAEKKVIVQGG
jgi:ABC-2 type transport system permease protein